MKKTIIFTVMLALCLTGCDTKSSVETKPEQVISTVSAEDCFLCGSGAKDLPYWGQNNVGIISLNTFEVMPIEINRYDDNGVLIAENTGHMTSRGFQNNTGFRAHVYENADRGRAKGSITFNADETLDTEKTATFLCQACLDAVLSNIYTEGSGIGILNFATKQLRAFEEPLTGFDLGDYYIDCDWNTPRQTEASKELTILVSYYPMPSCSTGPTVPTLAHNRS